MKKRFFAVVLTATMVMGMSISALADTPQQITPENAGTANVEVTGTINAPQVKISVPTSVAFTMNPYELDLDDTDAVDTSQIKCGEILITNLGDTDINLGVTATAAFAGTTAGKTVLVTTDAAVEAANKGVVAKNALIKVGLKTAKTDAEAESGFAPDAFFKVDNNDIQAIIAKMGTAQALTTVQLAKDNDGKDNPKSRAYVDVTGSLAKTASVAWEEADALKITLKFSMIPTVIPTQP